MEWNELTDEELAEVFEKIERDEELREIEYLEMIERGNEMVRKDIENGTLIIKKEVAELFLRDE